MRTEDEQEPGLVAVGALCAAWSGDTVSEPHLFRDAIPAEPRADPAAHELRERGLDCPAGENHECREQRMAVEDHYVRPASADTLPEMVGNMHPPRSPNPVAIPPRMLRTIQARSSTSSSSSVSARRASGCVNSSLALYCGARRGASLSPPPVESDLGRQMVSKKRRKNLLRDE